MNEILRFVLVLLILTSTSKGAEKNAQCFTPNNEKGRCILITDCSVIMSELETQTEFATQSQCGYDKNVKLPLVCCGTFGKSANIEIDSPSDSHNCDETDLEDSLLFADTSICGQEREKNRILGGTEVELYEHPWLVALEYQSKHTEKNMGIRCAGSLINKNYVLTAAHCITNRRLELITVWLGDWNITSHPKDCQIVDPSECNDDVVKIGVKDKISYPSDIRQTSRHDIGIIRLEQEIPSFTDYIRPICLPCANQALPPLNTNLTVVGWGATENSTMSDVKRKVDVPLVGNDQCAMRNISISENDFCAGGEAGKDSCQGDSGGPIMTCPNQLRWYLHGVVSHGKGCGAVGYPAVYTQVSKYINWIKKVLKYHENYEPCRMSNDEPGYCIPLSMCKPFDDALKSGDAALMTLVINNQCNYKRTPYVCCGEFNTLVSSAVSSG